MKVDPVPDPDLSSLATRLTYAMEIRGIGVNALNEAIGKDRYVSRVASGKRPNPGAREIAMMAAALRVPFAWLAIGEGSVPTADVAPVTAAQAA